MRELISLLQFVAVLSLAAFSVQGETAPDESDYYANSSFSRYVNPLIGTAGEGYTYPGAVSPWGMVSASPHTTYTSPLGYALGDTIAPAGYYFGEPAIEGFGQTHLSGVACNELGAPVLAVTTGELTPRDTSSSYSNEIARAGFYSVHLEDANTIVAATTTQRAAYYRIRFGNDSANYVLLDAAKNLSWISHKGFIKKAGEQEYVGWSQTGNFCAQGNEQKVYFSIKVVTPPITTGIWQWAGFDINAKPEAEGKVGAWFEFQGAGTVEVAIGISYVSMANARENRETEIGHKSFDTVLRENIARWEEQLGKIVVIDPAVEEKKTLFYTALYHSLLHPNVISDVNGDYPLYASESGGSGNNTDYPRYGLFSLWDSYRNVHALLSLLYPEQQQAMLYTLEDMSITAGHAPRWELYGSDVNLMVGEPALSVLAEGLAKGFDFRNPERLFSALYDTATSKTTDWRPGNAEYLEKGYIPEPTGDVWGSVSTTLEYSYHDWALSRFADAIGRPVEATALREQSLRWRILFDSSTGTVRPKQANGEWLADFDPAAMDDSWWVKLVVKNHGGPGFVEGNAYQYTYMVPHDQAGLAELFGSIGNYGEQLAYIFDNNQFTLWNEPNMAYPYLLGNDPARSETMQRVLQEQRSANFSNSPGGIPGNDDAGVLSAWYVFSALGFYPANPASGDYQIGTPLFNEVSLQLPGRQSTFTIIGDFDADAEYWDSITLDETELEVPRVSHRQLQKAKVLLFSKSKQQ